MSVAKTDYFTGAFSALMYTNCSDLVGPEQKAIAGGICNAFGGAAMLTGNALAGEFDIAYR